MSNISKRLTEQANLRAAQSRVRTRYNHTRPYADYLADDAWQRRRRYILRRAGYRCELCGASGVVLDVHHRLGYQRRGNEAYAELIAVCRACHGRIHTRDQEG